ncbi:hypothetical protein EV44_g4210 [Erysiphe necator]|uniref:Uncharacterized protein n=1 Tax=Uncinula necator TaxID=52586 RepID=A0A0B1NZ79_UNCNE|nr:hypothetical protein EV44_g4210 [Erysiphe necator]
MNWLDRHGLILISEIGVPAHNLVSVIDLCFASEELVSKCITSSVQKDLDVTTDHLPNFISFSITIHHIPPIPKSRFSTLDAETFRSLIEMQILDVGALKEKSASFIDNRAEVLVKILLCAFEGSAEKSLPHN